MLPRHQRLNLKRSFKWVRDGKKAEGNLVKLYLRFGENELPLVGVATSKDSFKRAVDRNLAKRKVFSSFQSIYQNLPKGLNIIAMPRSAALNANQEEIDKEIKELLKDEKINNISN